MFGKIPHSYLGCSLGCIGMTFDSRTSYPAATLAKVDDILYSNNSMTPIRPRLLSLAVELLVLMLPVLLPMLRCWWPWEDSWYRVGIGTPSVVAILCIDVSACF